MRRFALLAVLLPLAVAAADARGDEGRHFPEPDALRPAVAFWMRVYLEVSTDGGLLHDSRRPGVVYETVRFGKTKGRRGRERAVGKQRRYWRASLRHLASGRAPRNNDDR